MISLTLAEAEVKENSVRVKLVDLFVMLVSDSNLSVRFFTLEIFQQVPAENESLVKEMLKGEYDSKECLVNFLNKIPFSAASSDYEMLEKRSVRHLETLKESCKNIDELAQANTQANTQDENLDDTMNCLMAAMNTTVDCMNNDEAEKSNVDSDELKNEAQILLSNVEENLEKLNNVFNDCLIDETKAWIRGQITHFYAKYKFNH